MSTSSIKRQIRKFHVVVVQWTSKKCTKKRDARAELLLWSLNLLFFWSRRCGRHRSCLSSLFSQSASGFGSSDEGPIKKICGNIEETNARAWLLTTRLHTYTSSFFGGICCARFIWTTPLLFKDTNYRYSPTVNVPSTAISSIAPPPEPDLLLNKTVPEKELKKKEMQGAVSLKFSTIHLSSSLFINKFSWISRGNL